MSSKALWLAKYLTVVDSKEEHFAAHGYVASPFHTVESLAMKGEDTGHQSCSKT